jgi:zinc transport system substrate-binding protein
MRFPDTLRLGVVMLIATTMVARADVKVVASFKPVHSLVAGVMKGVGQPGLIVEGAGSPHTYAMKPSQARMLEQADLVFWVGPEIEAFLEKPLETIASKAKSVELIRTHGLIKLRIREGGAFEAHEHDEGEHHEKKTAADHTEKEHHDHGKKEKVRHDHDHGHGHGHGHEEEDFDAHVWLDPVNGKVLVRAIAKALMEVDPANVASYKANANALATQLDKLNAEVAAELKPMGDKRFIVFHDAYQNFEKRFGLTAAGSMTVSPEVVPGARRVKELRAKVKQTGVACVFAEPQFEPKLIATVIEGTSAKSGMLDPLGASLENGPDLYFKLIRNMAQSFRTCLSETH